MSAGLSRKLFTTSSALRSLRPSEAGEGSIEAPLKVLAELQRKGAGAPCRGVTPEHVAEPGRICEIVCVQDHYNV
jgi:hypothetical protein